MSIYWKYIKAAIAVLISIALVVMLIYAGYRYGEKRNADRVATLATELAHSQETLELQTGLYSRKVEEYNELSGMLDTSRSEVKALKQYLEEAKAKLLVTEQISLRWKKAYEDALAAQQTEEPPVDPGGPPRKRVEFSGDLGPIHASGHTLTDPPEAYLKLEQLVPLILTMNLVQNKNGTWTTFVTSSDENMDVKIDVAGVNPLVLSEKWYQRIWVEFGAGFLGDPVGSAGLRYNRDRWSVGASCSAWQTGHSCGGSVGFRIFK